jgi:hypothetical protein
MGLRARKHRGHAGRDHQALAHSESMTNHGAAAQHTTPYFVLPPHAQSCWHHAQSFHYGSSSKRFTRLSACRSSHCSLPGNTDNHCYRPPSQSSGGSGGTPRPWQMRPMPKLPASCPIRPTLHYLETARGRHRETACHCLPLHPCLCY